MMPLTLARSKPRATQMLHQQQQQTLVVTRHFNAGMDQPVRRLSAGLNTTDSSLLGC
ncbi:conserved hypothetical protein [Ricinus communis]|uniref:Uncharacterized protein n=1 Tax=Ricinus communis TaxID=3988 RepID=B9SKW1_RICCO|nr:conserved hypothetical protein [Ricinus communis]